MCVSSKKQQSFNTKSVMIIQWDWFLPAISYWFQQTHSCSKWFYFSTRIGLDSLQRCLPSPTILRFYNSYWFPVAEGCVLTHLFFRSCFLEVKLLQMFYIKIQENRYLQVTEIHYMHSKPGSKLILNIIEQT